MLKYLLLLVVFASALFPLDLKVMAGGDAPLYKERSIKIFDQWIELTVVRYNQNGVHGPWDDEFVKLLRYCCSIVAGAPDDMSEDAALLLNRRIIATGECHDPLVYWVEWLLSSDEAARLVSGWRALEAFDADVKARPNVQRYPRILEAMVAAALLGRYGSNLDAGSQQKAMSLVQRIADSMGHSIRHRECEIFPAVWISRVHDFSLNDRSFGEPIRVAIDEAVADAKLDVWVGDALRGTIRIANAWAWRGTDWAHNVTEEGFSNFAKNLNEADRFLTASWKANPKDPLAAAYACIVARAGHSSTPMDVWLLRASKACFDHSEAFKGALNFMLPRWGGSYEAMLALGCDSADTGRFDTQVPWRLMVAAGNAIVDAGELNQDDELRRAMAHPRVAATIDACLDGYAKLNPSQAKRYACLRAALHWWGGRDERARSALAGISEEDLDEQVATGFRADLKAIKNGRNSSVDGF